MGQTRNDGGRGSAEHSNSASPRRSRTTGASTKGRLRALRNAEATVRELEENVSTMLGSGLEVFGVTGRLEYGPLRDALRTSRLRIRSAIALGAVGAIGPLSLIGPALLEGRVSTSLGFGGLALILAVVELVACAVAGVGCLYFSSGLARSRLVTVGGACGALAFCIGALAAGPWGLAAAAAVGGLGFGLIQVAMYPLLVDIYRPEVRIRMLCIFSAVMVAGIALGVALMSLATAPSGPSWRTVFLTVAAAAGIATAFASRVREVRANRWDGARLEALVYQESGGLGKTTAELSESDVAASSMERLRQVVAAQSAQGAILLSAIVGVWLVTIPALAPLLLRDRFSVGPRTTIFLLAIAYVGGLAGLGSFARRGEVWFRVAPSRILSRARRAGIVGASALALAALIPNLPLSVGCLFVFSAAAAVIAPISVITLLSVVRPQYRPEASLILGLVALLGGIEGRQLMTSIGGDFGVTWAFLVVALVISGISSGLKISGPVADADFESVIRQTIESATRSAMVSQGRHIPLLTTRHLDFAYGQVQVLFDVAFTVDEGEMVALLGTNGAGKSTLLRAISGLGFPARGSIHYRGADITHVEAKQRVRLGVTQIPGGRAVFGTMSVVDNLRVFGYTHGKRRSSVEAGIDESFAAFPRLAERRNQLASTLSGGEQQMLGVAKAFILRPRLLLIDELSLGLAPVIVTDLLNTVRQINASGTAVVLVEQSVNIALSLVDHAYFMEKGAIRFDGAADDLVNRRDLLRSVFLDGARKKVESSRSSKVRRRKGVG